MSESNRDNRIDMFEKANTELKDELKNLKQIPEYSIIKKRINKKTNLIRKAIVSLKTNGIKQTLKKVKSKLTRK